jgi:hypothetical protein
MSVWFVAYGLMETADAPGLSVAPGMVAST